MGAKNDEQNHNLEVLIKQQTIHGKDHKNNVIIEAGYY